jgi:serine/threonine-protein kinase
MTTALPPTRNPTLPPDVALRIDRVCDRFKAAWDAGTPPRLEDYLGDVPEPERPALLRELIPLDVHFRTQRGEKPTAPEYQARFPWAALGWLARELGEAGPAQAGRYHLFEEIGRGGMGEVRKCYDPLVDRDQAIKLLREQLLDQPELVRRFLEEGRINGRLQHPGIVPVYDLGELPDRRPFFTMKLVEGRTLAALLKERTAPGQDLPRFLTIFEQICQTVAYTHSHQVIHRDLKPANVMVGAFGEVQVMDWGLAKVLDRHRGNGAAASAPVGAGGSSPEDTPADLPTQEGQWMGTAPYVPPEQARGEVGRVDQRSDVFGLGAILCEILTGQPPFTGKNQNEVFAKARACDHAEALARLDGCGADAELVRLAKACLAHQPEDRPGDAGVVAQEVAAYLAGVQERLRATELERAAAEARAQEAQATAAAERRATELERAAAAEAKATAAAERRARQRTVGLAAAALLLVVGGGSWAWLAQQQRLRTDGAVTQSMDKARVILDQANRNPLNEPDKFREALAEGRKAEEVASTGGASAEVRQQATALVAELESEVEAADRDRRLLARALEVRGPREGPKYHTDDKGFMVVLAEPSADEQFVAAFREWGLDVDATPTEEAAARLKRRPAMVIEVVAALDEWASERWRQKPQGDWQQLAKLATALDDHPDSKSLELRAILAGGNLPVERALGELSHSLLPLSALTDVVPGDNRNQLRRLAEKTDAAAEPVLGLLLRARALEVAGDEARAERLLRAAVRARPQEVVLRTTLGELMERQRPPRWREAVECYEAARALRPQLGSALASALVKSGQAEDGLALFERLVKEQPDNPWLHLAWGIALNGQRRYKEAEAEYREAIRLRPDDPKAHSNLGITLSEQRCYKEAEAECREAIRLQPDLPEAHDNRGVVLGRQGRYKEAEAECREAIRLKREYPGAHNNLGIALNGQSRYKEAEAECREAIRLKPEYPEPHISLGTALNGQGRHKDAESECREAIRLRPDYPEAHISLGITLADQRCYKEADAECREAIRLRPDYPEAHYNLGVVLGRQGRDKEEAAEYWEAIRLKPEYPEAHGNLGVALYNQGRFAEARDVTRRCLELLPQGDPTRSSVTQLLRECERDLVLEKKLAAVRAGQEQAANNAERLALADLGQQPFKRYYTTSARLYAEAFANNPKLANDLERQDRYDAARSASLAAAGQGEDVRFLPDKVAFRLRQAALDWLRADLTAYAKLAERDDPALKKTIRERLTHWQQDPDLASVRDPEALNGLHEAERQAWRQLWDDVAALLRRVERK